MSQVQQEYYASEKYGSLSRFISYFYQIDAVRKSGAKSVLLVGVGDGVVPDFLRRIGIAVTTVDFDRALAPDTVADIRALPFADGTFDCVCAFEVLEHLPFSESEQAVAELARVSRDRAMVSVPHRRTGFEIVLRFPFIRSMLKRDFLDLRLYAPVRFPGLTVSGQHYWEIDGRGTTLAQFRRALEPHFDILAERTPVLSSYQRFFELRKKTV